MKMREKEVISEEEAPQQPPRLSGGTRMRLTIIAALIALALLILLPVVLITSVMRVQQAAPIGVSVTTPISNLASPLLIRGDVNDTIHTIHITGGGVKGVVRITATRWSEDGAAPSQYWELDNNGAMLILSGSSNPADRIDLDLVVPDMASLDLTTTSGDLAVANFTGNVQLKSDSGSIDVTASKLTGNCQIRTNTGTEVFNGELEAGANYQFVTSLGNIDVTLPSASAFQLDADNGMGTITSDFPQISERRSGPAEIVAQGIVGEPPANGTLAHLVLRSTFGAISLHQG
jgi:hypothetical protein